ncbi:MAG: hypothetical protein U0559_04300 [Anaerolineae bacterium]
MEQKTADNQPAPKAKRTNWKVVSVVAVVVGALVFGGGLVTSNILAQSRRGPGGFRPEFQIQAAKELPTEVATLRGILVQKNGNTLSVGQRNGGGFGGGNGGGGNNANTNLIDVVIDANTTLYHDTTQFNFNGQQPPSGTIQQTVEPGTIDAISTNSRITVWGTQSGNQIAAKVVVYSDPQTFRQPQ